MNAIKTTGLVLFLTALGLFLASLFATRYVVDQATLDRLSGQLDERYAAPFLAELGQLEGQPLGGKFQFMPLLSETLTQTNLSIEAQYQLSDAQLQAAAAAMRAADGLTITADSRQAGIARLPETVQPAANDYTGWLVGKSYESAETFDAQVKAAFSKASAALARKQTISTSSFKDVKFTVAKAASRGIYWSHQFLFFWLIIGLGTLGALVYIYPAFFDGMPGIKHNHIYHRSHSSRGLIGILTAGLFIGFYILLYFNHHLIAEWVTLVDPLSRLVTGHDASQWFMYGTLYTIAILVMGIRMFAKYRHSRYQQLRTASVMFFQTCFAFILPEILVLLNQPYMDLKNAWPLNYSFFFDYNLNGHIGAGTFGIWMLGWGIALTAVGVPIFTYFYGKRWYCSWVCGCGGLAETLGDPYRQLSDKSTEAWQIERVVIHGVLVFAVLMTGLVLYSLFGGDFSLTVNRWLLLGLFSAAGGGFYAWHHRQHGYMKSRKVLGTVAAILGLTALIVLGNSFFSGNSSLTLNSYNVRSVYGFAVGSIFAGVVGTGFYPILGNRPWCRFGCPLAAYLGLVQRFKSRFRITTNGGQCISCGNCSTYCEMGIDVRAYAQRGQNIVRASCVGCGVCAAVCPRGVLSLENADNTGSSRMNEVRH
jgi:polyferredoxin